MAGDDIEGKRVLIHMFAGRILVGCLLVFLAGAAATVLAVRSDVTVTSERGVSTCGVLGGGTITDSDGSTLDQRDPECSAATRRSRLFLELGIGALIGAFVVASATAVVLASRRD